MSFSEAIQKQERISTIVASANSPQSGSVLHLPKKLAMQTTDTEVTTPKIADTLREERDPLHSPSKPSLRGANFLQIFGETQIQDKIQQKHKILQKLEKMTKVALPESTFII